MTEVRTAPAPVYEFVITQLILRASGFKTSEMEAVLTFKNEKATNIDLFIKRKDLKETIAVGVINLSVSKVKKMWTYWLDVASEEVLRDFDTHKDKSQVFKCVDVLLGHLVKLGFEIEDTAIAETHDTELVH